MFQPHDAFSPPSLMLARDHIARLLAAYQHATGYPKTFCAKVARGEPKFAEQYQRMDFGFRSYDAVNSRLSAVWPDDVPWPAGIPRQAPATMPDSILQAIREREHRSGQPRPGAPATA